MTQIQWYPGHMRKAIRGMRTAIVGVDVVLELLDARLPHSSANPMVADLCQGKPVIRIMTRSDLADPDHTKTWVQRYRENHEGMSLAISVHKSGEVRHIVGLCRSVYPDRSKPVVAMVVGIPNVGKSTIINVLAGRSVARTGNEPAITRQQQRIDIGHGVTLLDTPGILWPNIENAFGGYRLAATGAIRETAMSHVEVAGFLAQFLLMQYPDALSRRYDLGIEGMEDSNILEALGRLRGCLGPGGVVDSDRAARVLINDFRAGRLGRITLETPERIERELDEMARGREKISTPVPV